MGFVGATGVGELLDVEFQLVGHPQASRRHGVERFGRVLQRLADVGEAGDELIQRLTDGTTEDLAAEAAADEGAGEGAEHRARPATEQQGEADA